MTAAVKPLPAWAETVRRKYVGNEASMFVLYGNVFDQILHEGKTLPLVSFLSDVLLAGNKDTVIQFDPSAGVQYLRRLSELPPPSFAPQASADDVLATLEPEVMVRHRLALIVSYAGSVAPPGEENFLGDSDRRAAVRLHRWTLSPALAERDNVVFLLVESLAELNGKIISNPRVAAVELPLPDLAERAAVVAHADPSLPKAQQDRLAAHTSGLRAVQIHQILTPLPAQDGLPDAQRAAFIRGLLGNTPDAAARADKLTALTRGMDADEIAHLIDPGQTPQAAPADSAHTDELIALVHRRKREIIEKECAGLIEFVASPLGLDAVGGNAGIKAELEHIAADVRSGDRKRCPMGLMFVGPMGTGKTFVAKCFARSSGLSAVTLKNFRSKWVGATEANLDKVLAMVKALGPIILIIDEGDRSFGGASEDSDGGTSSRVIAKLKEFMSDGDNRGVVLFILMTNRPDKLDTDIKRAGRLDRKIPFFYNETTQEVQDVLDALLKRYGVAAVDWAVHGEALAAPLVGYSNADLEALVLLAVSSARDEPVSPEHLAQAAADYLPSRDSLMLEYMEMLAVFEASRRRMLPARLRDLTAQQVQERLQQLRRALAIH
ncbi:MAG TPA: AAA family ATPase [Ideonella sp.]|nr:AAA family ATPase [Ideonella sp.]